jgi:hypothetical protein
MRHRYTLPLSETLKICFAAAAMLAAVMAFDARGNWLQVIAAIILGAGVYAMLIALMFPQWREAGLRVLGLNRKTMADGAGSGS